MVWIRWRVSRLKRRPSRSNLRQRGTGLVQPPARVSGRSGGAAGPKDGTRGARDGEAGTPRALEALTQPRRTPVFMGFQEVVSGPLIAPRVSPRKFPENPFDHPKGAPNHSGVTSHR